MNAAETALIAALAGSPEVRSPVVAADLVARHRSEVLNEGADAGRIRAEHNDVIVRWLLKKAAEYRAVGGTARERRQHVLQAEAIERLADKIRRGAARPNNLLMPGGGQAPAPQPERQCPPGCIACATDESHDPAPQPETTPDTEPGTPDPWQAIADALNAVPALGVDLDGTITDHDEHSVVWDRTAQRWVVAAYDEDDEQPKSATDGLGDTVNELGNPVPAGSLYADKCAECTTGLSCEDARRCLFDG